MLVLHSRSAAQDGVFSGYIYPLHRCFADLKTAGVSTPRAAIAAAYEQYLTDLVRLRQQSLAERVKAQSRTGFPSRAQATQEFEVARKMTSASAALEDQLFDALQAQTPENSQPALARVRASRAAWRLVRGIEREQTIPVVRVLYLEELALSIAPDAPAREAVRAALARSVEERNRAGLALLQDVQKSNMARAAAAESEGLGGISLRDVFDQASLQPDEPPMHPGDEPLSPYRKVQAKLDRIHLAGWDTEWKSSIEFARVQWQAVLDAAAALPPPRARRLLGEAGQILFPELVFHVGTEHLRRYLGWKNSPPECKALIREAAAEWVRADETAIRAVVSKYFAALNAEKKMPARRDNLQAVLRELDDRQAELLERMLARLKACEPPPRKDGDYEDDVLPEVIPGTAAAPRPASLFDRALEAQANEFVGEDVEFEAEQEETGVSGQPIAPPEFSEGASGLPSTFLLADLLTGLGVDRQHLPLAEQIRAEAEESWAANVSPAWAEARDPDRHWKDPDGNAREAAEGALSATYALQRAFAAMQSAQHALADSLVGALGKNLPATSEVALRAALCMRDPGGWKSVNWQTEDESFGGIRFDPAEILALAKLPADDRTAAVKALIAVLPALEGAQRDVRLTAIQEAVNEVAIAVEAPTPMSRQEQAKAFQDQEARRKQLLAAQFRAVNTARANADAAIEAMCAAVSPASAARLRADALRRAFPTVFETERQLEQAVDELAGVLDAADPGLAKFKEAKAHFLKSMSSNGQRFVDMSKSARSLATPPQRSDFTLPAVTARILEEDLWYERAQRTSLLFLHIQDALPLDIQSKSPTLMLMKGRSIIDPR